MNKTNFSSKLMMLVVSLFAFVASAFADNEISIADFSIDKGTTKTVAVEINNAAALSNVAFQLEIKLPAGLTFANSANNQTFKAVEGFTAAMLGSAVQTNGNMKYQGIGANFAATQGAFANFDVVASKTFEGGAITITAIKVAGVKQSDVTVNVKAEDLNEKAYEAFAVEFEGLQQQFTMVLNTTVAAEENQQYEAVIDEMTPVLNSIQQNMATLQTWAEESYNAGTLAKDLDEILGSFEGIQIQLTQFVNTFNGKIEEAKAADTFAAEYESLSQQFTQVYNVTVGAEENQQYETLIAEMTPVINSIYQNMAAKQTWAEESMAKGTLAADLEEILASFEEIQIQLTQFKNTFDGALAEIKAAETFAAEYESYNEQFTQVYNVTVNNPENAEFEEFNAEMTPALSAIAQNLQTKETWATESMEKGTLAADLDEILASFEEIQIQLTQFLNTYNEGIEKVKHAKKNEQLGEEFIAAYESLGKQFIMVQNTTVLNPENAEFVELIEKWTPVLNGIAQNMQTIEKWGYDAYEREALPEEMDDIYVDIEGVQNQLAQFLTSFNDDLKEILDHKAEYDYAKAHDSFLDKYEAAGAATLDNEEYATEEYAEIIDTFKPVYSKIFEEFMLTQIAFDEAKKAGNLDQKIGGILSDIARLSAEVDQYLNDFNAAVNGKKSAAAMEEFAQAYESLSQQFTQVYNTTVNAAEYQKYEDVIEEYTPILNAIQMAMAAIQGDAEALYEQGTLHNELDNLYLAMEGVQEQLTKFMVAFKNAIRIEELPALAAGDYFIRNVETGKYLNGGNSWGTQASLTDYGQKMTVAGEEGVYTIDSHIANNATNHFVGENGYVDSPAANLTVKAVDDNIYTISVNGKYFAVNSQNTIVTVDAEKAGAATWEFVTVEDILAEAAEASYENPVELTSLIADPDFGRNNQYISSWDIAPAVGGANENMNAEKWGGNSQEFVSQQTIENLPNGKYVLAAQGYYRYNNTPDNTNDVAAAAHADGTEHINSYLFANDVMVPLKSIADEESVALNGGNMPFSQGDASAAFGKGAYQNALTVIVTDGTLTLGVKKIAHEGTDWTVWDNIQLAYFGPAIEMGAPTIAPADGEEIAAEEFDGVAIEFAESNVAEILGESDAFQYGAVMLVATNAKLMCGEEEIASEHFAMTGSPESVELFTNEDLEAGKEYTVVIPAGGLHLLNMMEYMGEAEEASYWTNEAEIKVSFTTLPEGGDMICDLTQEMFKQWDSPAADSQEVGAGYGAYEVGVSTGMPYGNGNVDKNLYAKLDEYSKLIITVSEGTPRPLFNRDVDGGQAPDHLIDIPNNADQTAKYQTKEGNTYTIDLAAIMKDYGYVHLHAIKGAAWQNVTVTSMKLEKAATPTEPTTWDFTKVWQTEELAAEIMGSSDWASSSKGRYSTTRDLADEELPGINGAASFAQGLFFTGLTGQILIGTTTKDCPYIQMNNKNQVLRIANLKAGDVITMGISSTSKTEASFNAQNLDVETLVAPSSSVTEVTAKVAANGDVILTTATAIRVSYIKINDEATGIEDIQIATPVIAEGMYDLSGRKISAPVKGQMYILNGKKYIAK